MKPTTKSLDVLVVRALANAVVAIMETLDEHWEIPPAMRQIFAFSKSNLKHVLEGDPKQWEKVKPKVTFNLEAVTRHMVNILWQVLCAAREINNYRTMQAWKKMEWIRAVTELDRENQGAQSSERETNF